MIRTFVVIVTALFTFALASQGQAAGRIGVEPGASIRFQIFGDSSFRTGFLSRFTPDSMVVERCPTCYGRLRYGRGELARLDVSKRTDPGSRALTGFAIGGAAGLALGYLSGVNCKGGDKCDLALLAIPFGGILGGLIGGMAGYLSGFKWQPVTLTK